MSKVLVYASGTVNISHTGRSSYTVICNLSAERQGVSVTTCAMLQNIKKSSGKAIFYYDGTDTCADIATYGSAPVPVYIGDY